MRCAPWLASFATNSRFGGFSGTIASRIKTGDYSNRFPGVGTKKDTGAANLRPAYSQRGLPHVECDQRVCSPIDRRFKHHLIATITSVSATGSAASKLAATWTAILPEAKLDGGVKPVKVPRANFCSHYPFGNYPWRLVAGSTSGIYRRKPAPSQ